MTSTRTRALRVLAAAAIAFVAVGCRSTPDVVMWGPCAPGSNPTGTDGRYSMVCTDGVWTPVMTVDEFVRLNRGDSDFVIAPLPKRPVPPKPPVTTTTVRPPVTTTTSTTTTTVAPTPAPGVEMTSPSLGPVHGATVVTLTGTNFTGATAVTFGGAPATAFTVVSDTQITAVTPTHAAGSVAVTVTTAVGTATMADAYTYVETPTITDSSPNVGPSTGGTEIYIIGSAFTGATSVTVGGVPATLATLISDTLIIAITPAHAAGSVAVAVTTAGGTATEGGGFTYVAAPTVTAASPNVGPSSGGTTVTVTGTNFLVGTTHVYIGDAYALATVNSATSLTVTTPSGDPGAANITVSTIGGSATLPNGFTYVDAP